MTDPEPLVSRPVWQARVESAWQERSVVWLSGVRRVGKTCLCQSLSNIEYLDCELPRVRRSMEDPESFLDRFRGRRVVLDEVHRLRDPSELLKIAADHFPDVRLLATGSSTLGASAKFRDTLVGRKRDIWLPPMVLADLDSFGNPGLEHRMLRGGLPPFFLSQAQPERDFQEWVDAYWAKDVLELFRLERRASFQRLLELLLVQSGGIFEATRLAAPCEVSRNTVMNYLRVLEATHVAHVIRPFSSRSRTEIVAAPKVYAFDTGFVCYHRGWTRLRPDDLGAMWEHIVLNELQAHPTGRRIQYWRDKRGHEVDFVLPLRGGIPVAVECKWSARDLEPRGLRAFRRRYPEGPNYIVCHDVDRPYRIRRGELELRFVSLPDLVAEILSAR